MDKLAAKLDKLGMQNRGEDEDEDEEGSEGGYQGRELAAHEQARLVALEKLHDGEYMDLEREYERERCILEAKYVGLRAPMFEQRAKIIAGTVAVPPLEVEEGETPPPASGTYMLQMLAGGRAWVGFRCPLPPQSPLTSPPPPTTSFENPLRRRGQGNFSILAADSNAKWNRSVHHRRGSESDGESDGC